MTEKMPIIVSHPSLQPSARPPVPPVLPGSAQTAEPAAPGPGGSPGDTKLRLLHAACDAFARHGFQNTTIRDICAAADANLAAVNYHFGDKAGLYRAALRFAYDSALERHPPGDRDSIQSPPEAVLQVFIANLLHRMLDGAAPESDPSGGGGGGKTAEQSRSWHARMLAREMIEPTPAFDELVLERFLPQARQVEDCIAQLLGPSATPDLVRACTRSLFGQAFLYKHGRAVVERIYPDFDYSSAQIAAAADHIARFTLAALRQLRAELDQAAPPGEGSAP